MTQDWILVGRLAERMKVVERKVDTVVKEIETAKTWVIRVLITIAVSGSWLGTVSNLSPQELGEKIAAIVTSVLR